MSFNVSGLSQWVENNRKEIAVKAVASAKFAKLLIENKRVISGVKTREAIRLMDTDVTVQDGSSCGRNPLGSTTLTEKFIDVKPMKDEQDFCAKSLRNTVFAEFLQKGQAPAEEISSELSQAIMDYRSAKISAKIEDILWSSDTAATGSTGMNLIDGVKKQVGVGTAITATGSTIIAKLQSAYLQMPVVYRTQEDFRIFIGEDQYEEYLVALDNANSFRETNAGVLKGTTAKLFPTPGLNGSDKVYMTRISNFVLGMDGEGDQDYAEFKLSEETKKHYMDFHWAVGVKVITTTEVGVATI